MRILKEDTVGLLIDMQEKLFPHMTNKEGLLDKTGILLDGLSILGINVFATQQYTKGLGSTLEGISSKISGFKPVEKLSFSCCDEPDLMDELDESDKRCIIISGIEAHVCVLQTALDLKYKGFIPVVVEDCISSRNILDKQVAVERMRKVGAIITTCESVLFELTRYAGTESFKAISKLVK